MWIKSHSIIAENLEPYQIWQIWSDINNRPAWDLDIEWAELTGEFKKGAIFKFKPVGGPKLSMTITDCVPNRSFTDCYSIPFAKLYGIHHMEETSNGLKITTTIKVTGVLGWLLRKIIAEKVAAEIPEQTIMLVKLASQVKHAR